MVRISQTLLPSSSQGIPQVEITNTSIEVNDITSQTLLSNIDTAVSGTLNVSDSTAQASLSTIATNTASLTSTLNVSDSTAQSSLSSIDTAVSGTLNVSDSTAQSSLSSINTALSGTLAVSSSSTISGSTGNLYNNTSVSSGTDSSIVSVSSKTKNTIYVTSDMGGEVRLYVRGTSAGGFHYHSSIYPQDPSGGMGGGGGGMGSVAYDGVLTLKDEVIDAIKLTATGSETITASVFSRA